MPAAVKYRTNDSTRWGTGLGRNLTAAEFDINLWNLAAAIVALETSRPEPDNISSINVDGVEMRITLTSGKVLGPIPLPVLAFKWRKAWAPFTEYNVLDTFVVDGKGIYYVLEAHTSAATFDETRLIGGHPAYQIILSSVGSGDPIYDIGFYYPGRLSDSTAVYLYQEYALREITIPSMGDQHNAYLQVPPSTARQVLSIFHDDALIGSITFEIGANIGTVALLADVDIPRRNRLSVGPPALADATAAGLTIEFAAQRIF